MSPRVALLALALASIPALAASGAGQGRAPTAGWSAQATGTSASSSGPAGGSSMRGGYRGAVPPPDPKRKITEQDCSKPIVRDGGNLRCK